MTTGYYCAIFPFCGGGKQKTTENKGILWLGYHRYPSKYWRQKQFYVAKFAILHCGSIEYCGVEEGESL